MLLGARASIFPHCFLWLEIEDTPIALCCLADGQQASREIASPYPPANSGGGSGGIAAGERLLLTNALPFSSQSLLWEQKASSVGGGGGCVPPRDQGNATSAPGGSRVPPARCKVALEERGCGGRGALADLIRAEALSFRVPSKRLIKFAER